MSFFFNLVLNPVSNSLDQEWLVQPVSLPSPEEQDGDVKPSFSLISSLPPQSLPIRYCSTPITPPLLTPDPSLPGSPVSIHSYSSEEEEIKDVLAIFEDRQNSLDTSATVQPSFLSQSLPIMSSPPQTLDVTSPSSSYLSMISSPPSPQDSDSCVSIRDLLGHSEYSAHSPVPVPQTQMSARSAGASASGSTAGSRKRKSRPLPTSGKTSCAPPPAPKRRMSKASKKDRKREQNKTAALRYRQKKKEEKSDVEVHRAKLEEKNQELKAKVNSLSTEINYLKKLWSEVCENKKCNQLC